MPIAVADDEGSESEEDEFKPRGEQITQMAVISKCYKMSVNGLVWMCTWD